MAKPRRKRREQEPEHEIDQLFPPISFKTLQKFQEKPGHYLVGEGFIKRGAGMLLIGSTGIGKSVLAEQISVCVATGRKILGRIKVIGPRKVMHVQAENDMGILKRDFVSIAKHLKVPPGLLDRNLVIRAVPGMVPGYFANWLEKQIKIERPSLLIIDPYQSFVGGVNLNNTEAWFNWIMPIEALIRQYNFGLLLTAHTGKPKDRSDWSSFEMIYAMLGTSVAQNWARSAVLLNSMKGDKRFKLTFSKGAEFTGMESGGHVVRELYIEHSGDRRNPHWNLSDSQLGEVKVDYRKVVRDGVKKYPRLGQVALARKLKLSPATVNKYIKRKKEG